MIFKLLEAVVKLRESSFLRCVMRLLTLLAFILFSSNIFAEISLSELGMESAPISEAEKTEQMELKRELKIRHEKLKTHEILGLTTWGLMTATMLTGGSALDSDMHMYLGMATGVSYLTTAYFSLTAPKPSSIKDKPRMKWHKNLAWVHFPLMLLVPYLGYMYKKHEEDGKKHSSLEKQHSTFAGLLYGTFTISAALMVIEF